MPKIKKANSYTVECGENEIAFVFQNGKLTAIVPPSTDDYEQKFYFDVPADDKESEPVIVSKEIKCDDKELAGTAFWLTNFLHISQRKCHELNYGDNSQFYLLADAFMLLLKLTSEAKKGK